MSNPSPEFIAQVEAFTGRKYDPDTLIELRELLLKWRDRGVSVQQMAADLECTGICLALFNERVPPNMVLSSNHKIIALLALTGKASDEVMETIADIDDRNARVPAPTDN